MIEQNTICGCQKQSKIFFSKVPKLTCAHPNNKESDCKKSSCECDLEYVTSVVQSVKADLYNIKYSRTKLDFEVKMDNPKTNGFAAYNMLHISIQSVCANDKSIMLRSAIREPDSCCGEHPNRFPFNSRKRSCCQNRTYDPNLFDCCEVKYLTPVHYQSHKL